MTERATPSSGQRELLRRHGLIPKRDFGQNFLVDPGLQNKLAERVAEGAQGVVEIGAGLGALTRPLLDRGLQVIAIERDRDLIPALRQEFADTLASGQLRLLEADAKSADYTALLQSLPAPRVLAGNLPYQLTGPLLRLTPSLAPHLARVVFLLQLEVAERLAAAPSTADYGALSVFLQAAFQAQRAFVVRAGAFYPQPKVDSAVAILTPLARPISEETPIFTALVHAAFRARRKTLRNAWAGLPNVDSEQLARHAQRAGIDLGARGETLSVEDYARMARELGG